MSGRDTATPSFFKIARTSGAFADGFLATMLRISSDLLTFFFIVSLLKGSGSRGKIHCNCQMSKTSRLQKQIGVLGTHFSYQESLSRAYDLSNPHFVHRKVLVSKIWVRSILYAEVSNPKSVSGFGTPRCQSAPIPCWSKRKPVSISAPQSLHFWLVIYSSSSCPRLS